MSGRRFIVPIAVLAILVFTASIATAQDEPSAPVGITNDTPANELAILLKPLTKAELEKQVGQWEGWLEATGKALANEDVLIARGEGDKSKRDDLRKERDGLVSRFEVVLAAYEAIGGDAAAQRKWLAGISGSPMEELDLEDPAKLVNKAKDWVVSPDGGLKWGKNILLFIVTIIVFKILANLIGGIIKRAVGKLRKTSELLRDFFVNTTRKVVMFIGIIIALSFVGVDIGPFLAAIGALGFIIGFALQGTLANFASGVMILLYRPYDIGDVVEVSGVLGKVSAMSLVSTTLKTPDNQLVVVPNGSIWGGIITNVTGSSTRRIDMVFGIGYGDDIAQAQGIIERILTDHPKVLDHPEPVVKVHELADSSVNFVARPWVSTSDYWDVYWDVTRAVKEKFDAEGVSIPFPQQDVHMHNVAAE